MLRRCRALRVVFTHAFPALAAFADANFLPEHPLRGSPLWLDENDFINAQQAARARGVPSPLQINPLSHHPELSPYARKGRRVSQKRRRTATGAARAALSDGRDALTLAESSGLAAGGSPVPLAEPPIPVDPPSRARSKAPYTVPVCSLKVWRHLNLYNMDQMTSSGEYLADSHRGLLAAAPQGESAPAEVTEQQGVGQRSSWGGSHASHARPPSGASSVGERAMWALASTRSQDGTASLFNVGASSPATRTTIDGDGRAPYAEHADRVKQLRFRFPNPRDAASLTSIGHDHTRSGMLSIKTGRNYGHDLQAELVRLRHAHGYYSQYWGTEVQWRAVGAQRQRGEEAHLVYVPAYTKVVHISLIENAEEVLRRSFISGKSGMLLYMFGLSLDVLQRVREAAAGGAGTPRGGSLTRSGVEAGAMWDTAAGCDSPAGPHAPPSPHAMDDGAAFREAILLDMALGRYRYPLYFSGRELAARGVALRPDARGISMHALQTRSPPHDGMDLPPSMELIGSHRLSADSLSGTVTVKHYYHLSQVFFPTGFTLPLRVVTAELESNPRVSIHGVTGRVLPFTELALDTLMREHPELGAIVGAPADERARVGGGSTVGGHADCGEASTPDRVASPVVREGAEPAGVVPSESTAPRQRDGEMGEGDGADFLEALAVSTSSPAGSPAPLPAPPENEAGRRERLLAMPEADFAALVRARADPTHTRGRSLWFLAEDVLQLDGIVDVNSAPVEVRVLDSAAAADGLDSAGAAGGVARRSLFNVDCLLNPEEGFRIVNQRVPGHSTLV